MRRGPRYRREFAIELISFPQTSDTSKEMNRLYWIYQSGTIPSQELAASLGSFGFQSDWLEDTPNLMQQMEALDLENGVILLSDDSDDWCVNTAKAIRALSAPICYAAVVMTRHPASESLSWLIESGLDDFLDTESAPASLASRLKLRLLQARGRMARERQFNEQSAATAKSETVLKQREEFLSVCAHDLRSPLGLIQASLTMILGDNGKQSTLSSFHRELLERSRRQATQSLALVGDLLDVMAHEQGLKPHYQLLNLDAFLQEFHRDYKIQAESKGVNFHYHCELSTWRVLADEDRVRQLLQNLFTNALKFTDSGKNIYLRVESFKGRRRVDPPYPMVVITLQDEGKGIAEPELKKIFDRFSQVKTAAKAQGRGLGLTVAKQISNLHDGNIWVESEEGRGSTFHALFPHVVSEPAQGTDSEHTIVIAEPTIEKRDLLFGNLTDWGYKPIFVKDGVEAVAMLYFRLPKALILTSGLPKMDEMAVTALLKGDPATCRIPVFLANEVGLPPQQNLSTLAFDGVFKLPLVRASLDTALGVAKAKKAA